MIGSFYYEHVFKLPRQKGLLFLQCDLATVLFSICIAKQAEHQDCKNPRLRVCPSCYNRVHFNTGTVKTYACLSGKGN